MQRRAERRVPGKRQLFRDSEDADFLPFLSFNVGIARQDESCLRKIHLTRERLHFVIIQAARVGENGERISRQQRLGEDIKLDEFVTALRHKNLSTFRNRNQKKWLDPSASPRADNIRTRERLDFRREINFVTLALTMALPRSLRRLVRCFSHCSFT